MVTQGEMDNMSPVLGVSLKRGATSTTVVVAENVPLVMDVASPLTKPGLSTMETCDVPMTRVVGSVTVGVMKYRSVVMSLCP